MSSYMHYEMLLFLQSACMGAGLLLCYDLLRVFRNIFPHSNIAVGMEDILFWIGTGILVFVRIYLTNQGILRSFLFLGLFLGAILCHMTVSPLFINILTKFLGFPVLIVKKSINRLLFLLRSCKLYLYNFAKRHLKCGKIKNYKTKKGKQIEDGAK